MNIFPSNVSELEIICYYWKIKNTSSFKLENCISPPHLTNICRIDVHSSSTRQAREAIHNTRKRLTVRDDHTFWYLGYLLDWIHTHYYQKRHSDERHIPILKEKIKKNGARKSNNILLKVDWWNISICVMKFVKTAEDISI